jgi:hypothetical protein
VSDLAKSILRNDETFDPNGREIRVELAQTLSINIKTGKSGYVNALRIYGVDTTPSGRAKTVDILGGPITACDDNYAPSYADLLEAAARIFRQREAAS